MPRINRLRRWAFCLATATSLVGGFSTSTFGQVSGDARLTGMRMSDLNGYNQPSCDVLDPSMRSGEAPSFDETYAAFGDAPTGISANDAAGGYIDNPIVGNYLRFRFDAAYDNPLPDRAEFFYGQCGCYNPITPVAPGPGSPRAGVNGISERRVDYQDISAYLEMARSDRFSWFVEVPIRFLNPDLLDNTAGLGDINFGTKYALIAEQDRYLTFQFRVYTPSGDGDRGLGTAHFSLEPALLYWRRLTERVTLQGEFRDWISLSDSINPANGEKFSGNVLRYGIGLGYDIIPSCDVNCCGRLTAITEVVGWSIIGGFATTSIPTTVDTNGDSIVNIKVGGRYTLGSSSFYAGYGHALTQDVWYKDIFRLEWRRSF